MDVFPSCGTLKRWAPHRSLAPITATPAPRWGVDRRGSYICKTSEIPELAVLLRGALRAGPGKAKDCGRAAIKPSIKRMHKTREM